MTRIQLLTCDRCHKEQKGGFVETVSYYGDAGERIELELCSECWTNFHDWRWMRKEKDNIMNGTDNI